METSHITVYRNICVFLLHTTFRSVGSGNKIKSESQTLPLIILLSRDR